MNVLSMYALMGAYTQEGGLWVDGLLDVLQENVRIAMDALSKVQGISVAQPQGTYMLFLDCEGYCREKEISLDELLKKGMEVGVLWQDGRPFGGKFTIRLNLASPTHRITEAFDRLETYVWDLSEKY